MLAALCERAPVTRVKCRRDRYPVHPTFESVGSGAIVRLSKGAPRLHRYLPTTLGWCLLRTPPKGGRPAWRSQASGWRRIGLTLPLHTNNPLPALAYRQGKQSLPQCFWRSTRPFATVAVFEPGTRAHTGGHECSCRLKSSAAATLTTLVVDQVTVGGQSQAGCKWVRGSAQGH
jgi:hypothetical protein